MMEATDLTWAARIALHTMRKTTKEPVQIRFGRVSPDVEARVDAAQSEEDLDALFRRAAVAQAETDIIQGD